MKYFIQAWIVGISSQTAKKTKASCSLKFRQWKKTSTISWNCLIFMWNIFISSRLLWNWKVWEKCFHFFLGAWSEMIRWWKECKYLKIYPNKNILWKPEISLMLWQAMCKNLIPVCLFLSFSWHASRLFTVANRWWRRETDLNHWNQ